MACGGCDGFDLGRSGIAYVSARNAYDRFCNGQEGDADVRS